MYLRTKFQVSSIIQTSFRQRVILSHPPHPTAKGTPKKPIQIRVKDLLDKICVPNEIADKNLKVFNMIKEINK